MTSRLTFFLLFFSIFCNAQDFEGVIEYDANYTLHTDQIALEDLEKQMGTKTTTYFKNGYYMETVNAQYGSYQLYRHEDEKIYLMNANDDTLRATSCRSASEGKFEYEVFENADTILGEPCDKLVIHDDRGVKTYYYSSTFSTDPELYENYTASNKNRIVAIMKAVYLKLVLEYRPFTVEFTATNIERKKLGKRFFKLPKHKVLKEE